MAKKQDNVSRKLVKAGGWKLIRRVAKTIPGVGTVVTIGFVGYDIKRKGFVRGVVNSGLDAIPFVGMGKGIVELFTGDFLSDKPEETNKKLPGKENNEGK